MLNLITRRRSSRSPSSVSQNPISDRYVNLVDKLDGDNSLEAAIRITNLCDRWYKDNTDEQVILNRAEFGRVPGIFERLSVFLDTPPGSVERVQACKAIGFLAWDNLHNSVTIVDTNGMVDKLATLLQSDNVTEVEWAAGAIANICVNDDNDTTRITFAKSSEIVEQLQKACKSKEHLVKLRAVGAINNISRSHEAVKMYLVQAGIVEFTLVPIINSKGSGDAHDALVARAMMAAANISGRNEDSTLVTNSNGLETIVKCFGYSLKDSAEYAGVRWTTPLVLYPLFNLSVADANKANLLEFGLMEQLFKLLKKWKAGDEHDQAKLTMLELCLLTVHNMSFDKGVKAWFGKNDARSVLRNLVQLDPPRSFRARTSTKQIIENIFWEVDANAKDLSKRKLLSGKQVRPSSAGGKWVMLSYSWSVQPQVKRVADRLIAAGLNVWMDILPGCMEGHTLEAMADAVGNSSVVVLVVTRTYKESANCRREGSYAQDLKKPIVPVIMEPGYQMDGTWGWLGLVLAGKKFVDMTDEEVFEIKMADLIGEIAASSKASGVPAMPSTMSLMPLVSDELPDNIKEWLIKSGLGDHEDAFVRHELTSFDMIRGLTARDMERMALPIGAKILLSMFVDASLAPLPNLDSILANEESKVLAFLTNIGLDRQRETFRMQKLNNMNLVARLEESDLERLFPAVGQCVKMRKGLAGLPARNKVQRRKKMSFFGS